jgi:hypothetical protein
MEKGRDTFDVLVSMVQVVIAGVTEAMVPEQSLCLGSESMDCTDTYRNVIFRAVADRGGSSGWNWYQGQGVAFPMTKDAMQEDGL